MATYAVSFRLEHDSTWSERYDSFMEAVRAKGEVWEETTSFALVKTDEDMSSFERRLYLSRFAPSKDKYVVIDVTYDSAVGKGSITDKKKLERLLPGIALG